MMVAAAEPERAAFLAALVAPARARFDDDVDLAAVLVRLDAEATAAYPELPVAGVRFAAELGRRLGPTASPERLAAMRAGHVRLAIACGDGDPRALVRFEAELLDEVDACARRVRARPDQADEVRGRLRRILFVREPGRPAALDHYAGRADLRSYLRVIATRELVRVIGSHRRELALGDDELLERLAPASDPVLGMLRAAYRPDVEAALRTALAGLADGDRALLRYSLIERWSVDRIGALYGVHRATAARRLTAARAALGQALRHALAARLAIADDEVDSIVRLVQSGVDVSLARLLRL